MVTRYNIVLIVFFFTVTFSVHGQNTKPDLPVFHSGYIPIGQDSSFSWVFTKAEFGNSNFKKPVSFKLTKFEALAIFQYADFNSNVSFERVQFNKPVTFKHASFDSISTFSFSQYKSTMDCRNAKFISSVNFMNSKFLENTAFDKTFFGKGSSFQEVEFNSQVSFSYVDFQGDFNAIVCKFNDQSYFVKSNFFSRALFDQAKFSSRVNFTGAKFHKASSFTRVKFESEVDFSSSQLLSNIDFSRALFMKKLILTNSQINGILDFDFAVLPDTILVNDVEIKGNIDLSRISKRDQDFEFKIDLSATNVENVILDYSYFRLLNSSASSKREIVKLYGDLLKVQEKHNFMKGYKKLDIEYQQFKSEFTPYVLLRKNWDNFGYNKELILLNTLVLLTFCFIVIWIFFEKFLAVYCPKSLRPFKVNLDTYVGKKMFSYKLRLVPYTLYYTLILFFGLKMDLENLYIRGDIMSISWKKRGSIFFIFLTYFLGIVCTAYLANFIISR